MGDAQVRGDTAVEGARVRGVDLKLEAVVIPVADVERAKRFYGDLGWRLDADFPFDNGFRVVQFTPPGSGCSIQFGTNITSAAPGSAQGLYLIVSEIQAARDELAARGVEVSEVFHPGTPGAQFQPDGTSGRVSGPSPDRPATAPSPRSATRMGTAGCSRRSPRGCPDAWTPTPRHSPRRPSSRQHSGVRRPRTASTRSGPASTTRTGRTGTPSTSSGSRPARSCRHRQRLRRSRHRHPLGLTAMRYRHAEQGESHRSAGARGCVVDGLRRAPLFRHGAGEGCFIPWRRCGRRGAACAWRR